MHPRLDRDVRVGDARRKQLAEGTEVEGVGGCDAAALSKAVLELLEDGVLQDGVDDEDEGGHNAGEQPGGAFLPDESEQCAERGRRLRGLRTREDGLIRLGLARRHARVDDPDGVCDEHSRAACNGARYHGLDGRELLGGPASLERGLLEESTRPFVPVVVDEVCDADAEECGVETGVETCDALALDDAAGGVEGGGLRTFGFDLSPGRERDQGVSGMVRQSTKASVGYLGRTSEPSTADLHLRRQAHARHCRSAGPPCSMVPIASTLRASSVQSSARPT